MKLMSRLCAGLFVLCAGCSPLHQVHYEEANRWLPGARLRLLGKEAVVTTRAGKSVAGTIVALDTAGITVRPADSGTIWHRPLAQVESIQKPKKAWGMVGGILGGVVIAGFMGEAYAIGGIAGGFIMAMITLADLYEIVPPASPAEATEHSGTDPMGSNE